MPQFKVIMLRERYWDWRWELVVPGGMKVGKFMEALGIRKMFRFGRRQEYACATPQPWLPYKVKISLDDLLNDDGFYIYDADRTIREFDPAVLHLNEQMASSEGYEQFRREFETKRERERRLADEFWFKSRPTFQFPPSQQEIEAGQRLMFEGWDD